MYSNGREHYSDIQTVNSPMYDTHMSTLGNTAKLETAHSNIQSAQSNPSQRTYNALVCIPPSQHFKTLCQPGIVVPETTVSGC